MSMVKKTDFVWIFSQIDILKKFAKRPPFFFVYSVVVLTLNHFLIPLSVDIDAI